VHLNVNLNVPEREAFFPRCSKRSGMLDSEYRTEKGLLIEIGAMFSELCR
jgi:hypothetical protein